jgi:hypothetical protein
MLCGLRREPAMGRMPCSAHKHIVRGGVFSEEISMERQIAAHIIGALAQGIDPHSGEKLPADHPCQHPDTVRALFQAVQALSDMPAARRRGASALPDAFSSASSTSNAGKAWSDEEDQALAAAFEAGKPVPELAREHRRTRAAIQARLVRLGKLEPTAYVPRYRNPIAPAQAA